MLDAGPVASVLIENRTFDELEIGDSASLSRVLSRRDIELFAIVSGDANPAHLDPAYAETAMFHEVVAHGMWGGALVSAVLGTVLPGPGTIYLGQELKFRRPVKIGDGVTAMVTLVEKRADRSIAVFDCQLTNQFVETVVEGRAHVKAPIDKVVRPRISTASASRI